MVVQMPMSETFDVAIVGGGFCGLTAAFELSSQGKKVIVLEKEAQTGGLASCFKIGEQSIERYYHHFFRSDKYVFELARKLDNHCELFSKEVKTGTYISGKCYRLSRPLDLLRFKPLSLRERVLFGINTLRAQHIKDWHKLEGKTAHEWLKGLYGARAYELMWEPLLAGKFGKYYQEVSAVWFWNKIILRGGSRNQKGNEQLLYLPGSLQRILEELRQSIQEHKGTVLENSEALSVQHENGIFKINPNGTNITARSVILTTPLTVTADIMETLPCSEYIRQLRAIRYLGNLCVVVVLDRSLSDIYWMNINRKSLNFVGVIEHTNFIPAGLYGNRHIVYLTSYLDTESDLYRLGDRDTLETATKTLGELFPGFARSWIQESYIFRSRFSQHIVECNYSGKIPSQKSPIAGLYVASMAQIYPEDRGVNYAVKQGMDVSCEVLNFLKE